MEKDKQPNTDIIVLYAALLLLVRSAAYASADVLVFHTNISGFGGQQAAALLLLQALCPQELYETTNMIAVVKEVLSCVLVQLVCMLLVHRLVCCRG
jgi:hypothetical protein